MADRIRLVPERRRVLPNAKLSIGCAVEVSAPLVLERMELVLRDALGHEVLRDATIGPGEGEHGPLHAKLVARRRARRQLLAAVPLRFSLPG